VGEVILGVILMAVGAFHIWARRGLSETYANSFCRWEGFDRPWLVAFAGGIYFVVGALIVFSKASSHLAALK
jgi:hypothetical protein